MRVGTPVKLSVKIANKNGYNVNFRMNQNNQPSNPITLTPGENGEEYYLIQSTTSGIYGFYLDIELNGTTTKAHRAVYVKVIDGKEVEISRIRLTDLVDKVTTDMLDSFCKAIKMK